MANSRNNAPPEPVLRAVFQQLTQLFAGKPQQVLVGLSGGRDSVALLHALVLLRAQFELDLQACHVHHGLSPHADRWADFCSDLCARFEVPLVLAHVQVPLSNGSGLEAAARALRYQVYTEQAVKWIALAHHCNDQAETLLFNLLRGSGVRGAAGIPRNRHLNERQQIFRPLLYVSRTQITAYLQRYGLSWVDDESNADTRYSRNFLREEILPRLEQRFPAAQSRLAAAAEHFAVANRLLDDLARLDLGAMAADYSLPDQNMDGRRVGGSGVADGIQAPSCVPLALLRSLSSERALNLLRYVLQQQGARIPSALRLQEALQQFLNAAPDRHPCVYLGEFVLRRRRHWVELVRRFENSPGASSGSPISTLK